MSPNDASFRASLIAQLPARDDLEPMRKQILASIAEDEKRAKRQHIAAQALWICCAAAAIYFAWFDPAMPRGFRGPFTAGFLLFYGAWEVLKQRIKAARVDVLREVKYMQLQLADLSARMPSTDATQAPKLPSP